MLPGRQPGTGTVSAWNPGSGQSTLTFKQDHSPISLEWPITANAERAPGRLACFGHGSSDRAVYALAGGTAVAEVCRTSDSWRGRLRELARRRGKGPCPGEIGQGPLTEDLAVVIRQIRSTN